MHRRAFLATAGGGFAAGLAGCTAIADRTGDHDIGMNASAFLPDAYTVEAGDRVVWENTGSRAHTVTAYDGGQPDGATYFATGEFDTETEAREAWTADRSGSIYTGDRFEHTFEIPGTHHYFCIPHERRGMAGRIVVED